MKADCSLTARQIAWEFQGFTGLRALGVACILLVVTVNGLLRDRDFPHNNEGTQLMQPGMLVGSCYLRESIAWEELG